MRRVVLVLATMALTILVAGGSTGHHKWQARQGP
jgi:hypothetical protein